MGLSHGPQVDRPRAQIGEANLLRHLAHGHGRNLLGGVVVAVIVLAAALSVVIS